MTKKWVGDLNDFLRGKQLPYYPTTYTRVWTTPYQVQTTDYKAQYTNYKKLTLINDQGLRPKPIGMPNDGEKAPIPRPMKEGEAAAAALNAPLPERRER